MDFYYVTIQSSGYNISWNPSPLFQSIGTSEVKGCYIPPYQGLPIRRRMFVNVNVERRLYSGEGCRACTGRLPVQRTVHVDGVRRCLWTAATNGPIVHPPDDVWLRRSTVELYWQWKIDEFEEKRVPVPHCISQILYGLTRARTQASTVRGRRRTAWATTA
jgi:hypothetical protein